MKRFFYIDQCEETNSFWSFNSIELSRPCGDQPKEFVLMRRWAFLKGDTDTSNTYQTNLMPPASRCLWWWTNATSFFIGGSIGGISLLWPRWSWISSMFFPPTTTFYVLILITPVWNWPITFTTPETQFLMNVRSDRPSDLWAMMKTQAGRLESKEFFSKSDGTMKATIKKDGPRFICFLDNCTELERFQPISGRNQLSPVNAEYNEVSRLMDVADSMLEIFRFRHRQSRWTHAALWYTFQILFHDAFVLHCEALQDQQMTHEAFLVALATTLRDHGLSLLSPTHTSPSRAHPPSISPRGCLTRMAELELFGDLSGPCVNCLKRQQRYRCCECHQFFCRECMQQHWGLSEE